MQMIFSEIRPPERDYAPRLAEDKKHRSGNVDYIVSSGESSPYRLGKQEQPD